MNPDRLSSISLLLLLAGAVSACSGTGSSTSSSAGSTSLGSTGSSSGTSATGGSSSSGSGATTSTTGGSSGAASSSGGSSSVGTTSSSSSSSSGSTGASTQGSANDEADCYDGGLVCGTLDPVAIAGGPDSGILPLTDAQTGLPVQHFFCYPAPDSGIATVGQMFLHLVGTGSDPAEDHQFEIEACEEGFAAVGPAYENRDEVTATCDMLGPNEDACYTEVHEAVIYGNSYPIDAGLTPASYTPADSLVHRTATLLAYLAQTQTSFPAWATYSSDYASGDASHVVLAGHSQGSGHSLYWSHNLAPSREIMLSGPPDRIFTGSATATPTWIQSFAIDAGIAPGQLYGYNNVNDGVVNFSWAMSNDDALGMASATCAFDQSLSAGCHRVIIDAGCSSTASDYAHASTEVYDFGPAPICERGVAGHNNNNAWTYLLGE